MTERSNGPCTAWATIEDMELMPDFDPDDQIEPQVKSDKLTMATAILYRLSGNQFPGLCTVTIRPSRRSNWDASLLGYGWSSNYPADPYWNSSWGTCTCSSWDACTCSGIDEISLGTDSLVSIGSVKIDGATLAPSKYRIDNFKTLVRTDGQMWPVSQDMSQPSTAVGTFEVTFTYGHSIPVDAKSCAARLAYEFCKAYRGADNCLLPERIQSFNRAGVSAVVIDPMKFFDDGKTGIYEIDLWLSSVNPTGRRQSAAIASPDIGPDIRRINT